MVRWKVFRRAAGCACLLLVAVAGTARADDTAVTIDGFSYTPPSVTVQVGDSVTWTNNHDVGHTVTYRDASMRKLLLPPGGGTGTSTFATPGTYPYFCDPHPWMSATVIVEEAGAAPTQPVTATLPVQGNGSGGDATFLVALGLLGGAVLATDAALRRRAGQRRV